MYLRPLEPEDLELLYTIENDPSLWDTSNTDAPYSRFALKITSHHQQVYTNAVSCAKLSTCPTAATNHRNPLA